MAGFFDAGGKAVKFEKPGDSVTGRVLGWVERQAKVYGKDELAVWDDGSPKMEAVITIDVGVTDDEDDNGVRSLYVASTRQKRALIDALRRGGSKVPDEGGKLTMTYIGDDPASKNPRQPAKLYTAAWEKPEQQSAVFGTGDPQSRVQGSAATPPAAAAPVEDPWAPADQAAGGLSADVTEKGRQLAAMGLDAKTIAAALAGQGVTVEQAQGFVDAKAA